MTHSVADVDATRPPMEFPELKVWKALTPSDQVMLAADLVGSGKLIAIDRDPTVRPYFDRMKAAAPGVQTRFLRGDHGVVLSQLSGNGVAADAVLLDLGLSSMPVDRPERAASIASASSRSATSVSMSG